MHYSEISTHLAVCPPLPILIARMTADSLIRGVPSPSQSHSPFRGKRQCLPPRWFGYPDTQSLKLFRSEKGRERRGRMGMRSTGRGHRA